MVIEADTGLNLAEKRHLPVPSTNYIFGYVVDNKPANAGMRQLKVNVVIPTAKGSVDSVDSRTGVIRGLKHGSKMVIRVLTTLVSTIRQLEGLQYATSTPLLDHILPKAMVTPTGIAIENPAAANRKKPARLIEPEPWLKAEAALAASLNDSQMEAVRMIIDEDSPMVIVQGPPGTGKSKTLVGLVGAVFNGDAEKAEAEKKARKFSRIREVSLGSGAGANHKRILVCAPSNAAVDELVRRMAKGIKLSRSTAAVHVNVVRTGRQKVHLPGIRLGTVCCVVLCCVVCFFSSFFSPGSRSRCTPPLH